ncbi:MAG TPA: aminoacyl-tRNA hydrolase [Syntrophomonas sp.]|jgi:PTH1 family peptidyl-tRNA hydrolase|nr:aminoacyl-tRNA hydrolase [Syntrophomonas sp.]HRW13031.1 aminoacyl-tRNA hydrolase [Syntrophomonas sp.]
MKIIVGLGNPGKEYKDTRHNIGFMVLEEMASRHSLEKQESRFDAIIGHVKIDGEKVLLVKPLTYMNLSGRSVQPIMHWYKLALEDLMVVYDDMDLPVGSLRIRANGGTGGHKGMNSICERLANKEFARTRVGIGRPDRGEAYHWVLGKFSQDEKEIMQNAVRHATDALETWVRQGIAAAMNAYN